MTDELTFHQVRSLLLGHDWHFAKTMPRNPHWYTRRREWGSDQLFVEVVKYMRAHGYVELWPPNPALHWAREYTYLDVDEHQYWTMGDTLDGTILINRKPHGRAPRPPA